MKKMIVLVSMMAVSLSFFAGCDSKGKKCGKLFDKFATCLKDLGDDDKSAKDIIGEGKDKFISGCKKNYDQAKKMVECADKGSCGEFFKCALGVDLIEMKKQGEEAKKALEMGAEKPADAPAEKPADAPAEKPADAPAEKPADAPAADMPAEEAK
jgi:hypothetical protein